MGCNSSSFPDQLRAVVVGGGYAGVRVAMALRSYNMTLIDAKDSFVHNVANVRALVEPAFIDKMYISYSATFGDKFIQGKVVSIETDNRNVVLEDGRKVPYDILVLATGCKARVEGPSKLWDLSKDEAAKVLSTWAYKIKQAKRIGVVGGGAVGVEIAAEICTDYKDKDVILFHSSDQLIQAGLSEKMQTKLRAILGDRLKCNLQLGSKVQNVDDLLSGDGPFTVQLSDGSSHEVDLVIPCLGLVVNTAAYAQGLEGSMDDRGALKVNEYLEVEGHENIYALGDCTNVEERKVVLHAQNQVDTFLNNIQLLAKGSPRKRYKPDQMPVKVGVSLGRSSGLAETTGGTILPEFIITNLKSKGMITSKQWDAMKQKMP